MSVSNLETTLKAWIHVDRLQKCSPTPFCYVGINELNARHLLRLGIHHLGCASVFQLLATNPTEAGLVASIQVRCLLDLERANTANAGLNSGL